MGEALQSNLLCFRVRGFCGHQSDMGLNQPQVAILTALCLVVGISLQIVSCIVNKDGWPMLGILSYTIPPVIMALIGRPQDDQDDGRQKWQYFLWGFMVISFFGMPIVLIHGGTLGPWPSILSFIGTFTMLGGVALFILGGKQQSE